MQHLLIFDLDGTLVDSKRDLIDSVNAMRGHMGLPSLDDSTIGGYIGRGATALVRSALGSDASEVDCAAGLEFFLGYYHEHMLDSTTLYPHVRDTLDALRTDGDRLAILTNKPWRFSEEMLLRLGLRDHFFRVYGGNSFERKKPHPIGIERLIEEAGLPREAAMMIGDSSVDIKTARNANVRACGVTYGFQLDSFAHEPPDLLIDSMDELRRIVRD